MILQSDVLSDNEKRRIYELLFSSANALIQNPVPYKIGNYKILDVCGQVIAKKLEKYNDSKPKAELFLRLPYKTSLPTYLSEKPRKFIVDYILGNCSSSIYTQETINELVENSQIVMVTLYGNNAESTESVNIFDLVQLINIHLLEDQMFTGYFRYIMHEGEDNGKGCYLVDNDSILGKLFLCRYFLVLIELI